MPGRNDAILLVALAASVAAIDHLTKALLASAIASGRLAYRVEIVDGWLALEYTENHGAAFGLFSGLAPILTGVSIALVTGLLWHYLRQTRPSHWQPLATGAITGGAIGNLVDRIRLGYVTDFMSIGPWPHFNVDDSAITVGALALVWGSMRPPSGLASDHPIDQGSGWATTAAFLMPKRNVTGSLSYALRQTISARAWTAMSQASCPI